jgi:hypothetical protein
MALLDSQWFINGAPRFHLVREIETELKASYRRADK